MIARHRVVAVADAISVALLATALLSLFTGGFRVDLLGLRLSLRSPLRILLWAAALIVVRHLIARRPSLAARLWDAEASARERRWLASLPDRAVPARLALGILVAGFALLTALVVPAQFAHPLSVPDHGDPLFSVWRLGWIAHQLPRDPLHLFDANIFHPHARTLAYSDAMLAAGAAAAPWLWLGAHPLIVYNALLLIAIVLSGVFTSLLVHRLAGRWDAASVAGLLFAFCAFRFSHYSHLELQLTLWMPLGLLALHRTLATHRVRDGILTGLAVALQALSSLYYGLFFVVLLAVLSVAFRLAGLLDVRRVVRPLAAGALVCLTLVLPVTIPYWQNRRTVGERGPAEVAAFSAVPADYLVPHGRSVYRDFGTVAANGERQLFPGIAPVALAAIALVPPFSSLRMAYGIGLAAVYDASLGSNGHLYPVLYALLPPFRGFRAPARFAIVVALVLSVLAGLGLARALSRVPGDTARAAIAVAVAAFALFEARPRMSLEPVWTSPPAVYAALPADRRAVLVELPLPVPAPYESVGEDTRFMYFSTFHWHRLVNGASGFFPRDYYDVRQVMHEFPSEDSLRLLRRYGVEFVVINAKFYAASDHARLIEAVERRPDLRLVARETWDGSDVRLYRLGPPPEATRLRQPGSRPVAVAQTTVLSWSR